ncbi:MAG: hypothetical protein HXY22_09065 [Alphaproteobacteria bacterium]|nr:hypothetical protein [Alphaproteobacteria bacterium]
MLLQTGTSLDAAGNGIARLGARIGISRPLLGVLAFLAALVSAALIIVGAFPLAAATGALGCVLALGGAQASGRFAVMLAVLENVAQSVLAIAFALAEPGLAVLPALLFLGGVASAYSAALARAPRLSASGEPQHDLILIALAWRGTIVLACIWPSLFPLFAILGGALGLLITGVRIAAMLEDALSNPLD